MENYKEGYKEGFRDGYKEAYNECVEEIHKLQSIIELLRNDLDELRAELVVIR